MKVLFVCSGNANEGISPIIKNQGDSLKKARVAVEYFPIGGKGFKSYIKHIKILRMHLKTHKYDVFHAHYSLSAFTATLAGCNPLVVSFMGSDTKTNQIIKFILRFLARYRWHTAIVKSLSMQKDVGIGKAEVIPNGVDIIKVKPSNEIISINKKTINILFAANPERKAKNFPLAKNAISLLEEEKILFKVVYSKSHLDIIQEINRAHVLLVTSLWEGSPNIVKEAMACNCPIVSTDVGDVRWLFGDEPGHFITSFDPEDVAEKINRALDFSEKFGRTNGRQRIIELGLDSETVAKKIIDVYEEVLNNRQRCIRGNVKE